MTQTRAYMPDYLRLFALFGIVVVNIQFMAFSALEGFSGVPEYQGIDAIVHWLVSGIATLKTYGLFSFMFGVGLGFLMRAAERRGLPFGRIYRNRVLGLLLLGVLHGALLFTGDILVIYAMMGSILYLFRNWPVKRLVRVGLALLVIQILIAVPLAMFDMGDMTEAVEAEAFYLTQGTFLEVLIYRAISFAFTFPILLVFQGIAALGWFCLGLACVRSGIIDDRDHAVWRRARRWALLPGIGLSLGAAAVLEWYDATLGNAFITITAPLATYGYLGAIAWIARPPGPRLKPFLAAGGSSLTIYLGQSIVLTTIFAPFGLGLWERVSQTTAVLIALGVTCGLMIFVTLWRRAFRLGPFEWVLRKITYAGMAR